MNTPESEKATREFMAKIAQSISFGILDGEIEPRTGERYPEGKLCYSVNSPSWEDAEECSRIWLAYQVILPIMQDDISQKIRIACQFDIAVYLLREFAVGNLLPTNTILAHSPCLDSFLIYSWNLS